MGRFFAIVVGFIIYGSLYPFDFSLSATKVEAWEALQSLRLFQRSFGDMVANVGLFVPFGLLGTYVLGTQKKTAGGFLLALVLGVSLALSLQIAQVYLPSRIPSLGDVAWNSVGILIGGLLHLLLEKVKFPHLPSLTSIQKAAAFLILAWIGHRLDPFVPSLDVQVIKDSLKPVLLFPEVTLLGLLSNGVSWLMVFHLLGVILGPDSRNFLPFSLTVSILLLEVCIINNVVSANNVLGALLALIAWWLGFRDSRWRVFFLLCMLLTVILWKGLDPWVLATVPRSFSWFPFSASLIGDPHFSMGVLIQKLFLYGSLVWLVLETKLQGPLVILVAGGPIASLEIAQIYLSNHSPEITDPLLVLLLIFALWPIMKRTTWVEKERGPTLDC